MRDPKCLVVVRCGDNSLHDQWLGADRVWDLAVSYFGSNATRHFDHATFVHRYQGGKWDGLADFFREYSWCLESYDLFWLPDDDIAANCDGINRLFTAAQQLGLELAQPSLAPGSYLSHLVSLRNPFFEYRHTNMVEIMVPLLDRRLLNTVLPLFARTKSGFGLDYLWHRYTSDPRTRVAIIDSVEVTHTRPVGGPLRTLLAAGQETAYQEQERLLAGFDDVVKTEITLGGKLRFGPRIANPKAAATVAAIGWATRPFNNRGFTHVLSSLRFLVWVTRVWYSNMRELGRASASDENPSL